MKNGMVKIKKALISVSNKSGLKKFVSDLGSLLGPFWNDFGAQARPLEPQKSCSPSSGGRFHFRSFASGIDFGAKLGAILGLKLGPSWPPKSPWSRPRRLPRRAILAPTRGHLGSSIGAILVSH